MNDAHLQLPHGLTLNERTRLTLTGVTEVISFDENAVVLNTALGILTVHGSALQLRQLSPEGGQVAIDGRVSALIYEDRKEGGWLRRLLK